eukprot:6185797-Pleurochrysis_carterae.AAC.3
MEGIHRERKKNGVGEHGSTWRALLPCVKGGRGHSMPSEGRDGRRGQRARRAPGRGRSPACLSRPRRARPPAKASPER